MINEELELEIENQEKITTGQKIFLQRQKQMHKNKNDKIKELELKLKKAKQCFYLATLELEEATEEPLLDAMIRIEKINYEEVIKKKLMEIY